MDITKAFPSNFLKADDLQGATRTATIESVAMEEVAPGESKPVVRFVGIAKGLVLNKVNSATIANSYGTETESWTGRDLMLFSQTVDFQGRMVPAIRVATAASQAAVPKQPSAASKLGKAAGPAPHLGIPARAGTEQSNDTLPW